MITTQVGGGTRATPRAGEVNGEGGPDSGSPPGMISTAATTTTKKKFGKNLNKLVKPPPQSSAVSTTSANANNNASNSSFIAKHREGASSTGGGLLLLSTKRGSTQTNVTASSASIPTTTTTSNVTAVTVTSPGSTSSALLAKLSGGMVLSAKGAAAHKAATAASASAPLLGYNTAGPRPLNTPSLKSLVGASSVGDGNNSGASTAGWKTTPAPTPTPAPQLVEEDKPKVLNEPASSSKVWKLGNANTEAAAVLTGSVKNTKAESVPALPAPKTSEALKSDDGVSQTKSPSLMPPEQEPRHTAELSPKMSPKPKYESPYCSETPQDAPTVTRTSVSREARRRQSSIDEPHNNRPIQLQPSVPPIILKNNAPTLMRPNSSASKPQVALERLGKPKSKIESKLVLLGNSKDNTKNEQEEALSESHGDFNAAAPSAASARSYSSLLGGSAKLNIEEETSQVSGPNFEEREKRLAPPQRGAGRLFNPYSNNDDTLQDTKRNSSILMAPASLPRTPPTNLIHLNSYDDIDRGERVNTAPRMLFDPKSGSMVEARQPLTPPEARGSAKGGRGSKSNKSATSLERPSTTNGRGAIKKNRDSKDSKDRRRHTLSDEDEDQDDKLGNKTKKNAQTRKTGSQSRTANKGVTGCDSADESGNDTSSKRRGVTSNKLPPKKTEANLKSAPSGATVRGLRARRDEEDSLSTPRRGACTSEVDLSYHAVRDVKVRASPVKITEHRNNRAVALRSPMGRDGGGRRAVTGRLGGREPPRGGRHPAFHQQRNSAHVHYENGAGLHGRPTTQDQPKPLFDSGGLSLPEVAPQFNDDDFKVITDITDSVPAGMAAADNKDDFNSSLPSNAWQTSEAALAFAAVAAVHASKHKHSSNNDDDDDDDDDLLNVPVRASSFP